MKTIVNANEIKFRCSALGKIMTEPQSKSNMQKYLDKKEQYESGVTKYEATANKETKTAKTLEANLKKWLAELNELDKIKNEVLLSKTCKQYLTEVYINNVFDRHKHLDNKFITKGLEVESDSITLYSRCKKKMLVENTICFENDFIKGTPDIEPSDIIIDIKSSWDIFTFFAVDNEQLNDDYYWQLQGYMALTNTKSALLVYVLVDTPDALVNDEKRRAQWKMNVLSDTDPDFQLLCDEIDKRSYYSDIPLEKRFKEIIIERNDDDINRLYKRIGECRQYLNKTFFDETKNN